MTGLQDYRDFLHDLDDELTRIEAVLVRSASGTPCKPGCSECCRPLTVFPLEAHAILSDVDLVPRADVKDTAARQTCPLLTPECTCLIYRARPFLCRTRGFPILHVNGEGDWESSSCEKRGFPPVPKESPGLRLELWNARLFHLNEGFCATRGISPSRVPLVELVAPQVFSP
jgi:uncharacterized protein